MKKIILFIATSQDGFIADKNGGVDWLPHPKDDHDLEVVGYKAMIERIDTILMGSRSYQQILTFGDWAWSDKQTYVFSSQPLEAPLPCITIMHDSPFQFVNKMRDRLSDKDIWLLGGADLAKSFARLKRIDEIILTIVPESLGEGIPLDLSFDDFNLVNKKALMNDMVQKIYLRKTV